MCEYFYWNSKRHKFYCECRRMFMRKEQLCPVYVCGSCSMAANCKFEPCSDSCQLFNELDIDI